MTQTTDDRKAVVRRCLAAWDDGDMETFDEIYARDLTVHGADIDGLADLEELHATGYEAFPDLTQHRRGDGGRRRPAGRRLSREPRTPRRAENEWDPENLFRLNSNLEPTTGEGR